MVTLYTTGCPKCKVLKQKLMDKNVHFIENTNVDEMVALGIQTVPALKVGDKILSFGGAVLWVNALDEERGMV